AVAVQVPEQIQHRGVPPVAGDVLLADHAVVGGHRVLRISRRGPWPGSTGRACTLMGRNRRMNSAAADAGSVPRRGRPGPAGTALMPENKGLRPTANVRSQRRAGMLSARLAPP